MNNMNTNILIVDDEESVQRNIALTLCPIESDDTGMSGAADILFGEENTEKDTKKTDTNFQFTLTMASSGQKALDMVKQSLEQENPYAVVFCDMRMPGWDGLKTVEEIRAIDPRIEVVFLTAFSDHSIADIARSIGVNISYMSKPFSRPDLVQMATRSVVDWNKARELELFIETMAKMRGQEKDFETILNYIIGELCVLLGAESAAIAEEINGKLVYRAGKGHLANQDTFDHLGEEIPQKGDSDEPKVVDKYFVVPIMSFGIALTVASEEQLRPDKQYLLEVFMEHASIALKNCRLQTELTEKERLAEIGQAIGFVSHDIRGPIGQAEFLIKMLQKNGRMPWPPEVMYQKILHALDQAKDLADDILQFSKSKMTVTPKSTTISTLIEKNIDYWNHLANNYEVEFEILPFEEQSIKIDESRFMRAITNITKNALEATAGKPEKRVTLKVNIADADLSIEIEDTAGGIPENILPNLFKPFASAGKAHGTGFGLAIANEVVSLHQGTILVNSTEKGTEFKVCVPNVVKP